MNEINEIIKEANWYNKDDEEYEEWKENIERQVEEIEYDSVVIEKEDGIYVYNTGVIEKRITRLQIAFKNIIKNRRNIDKILDQIEDEEIKKNTKEETGKILNRYETLKDIRDSYYTNKVYGVGFIGEKGGSVSNKWKFMLQRCYDKEFHKIKPTYEDKEVCEEWLYYKKFEKWYYENHYELDNERVDLDKDILIPGNKVYSPDTCIFVPHKINSMFEGKKNNNGLPLGVSRYKGKYKANIKVNGESKYLGSFETIEEAEKVYNETKIKVLKELLETEYKGRIPENVYYKLIKRASE